MKSQRPDGFTVEFEQTFNGKFTKILDKLIEKKRMGFFFSDLFFEVTVFLILKPDTKPQKEKKARRGEEKNSLSRMI